MKPSIKLVINLDMKNITKPSLALRLHFVTYHLRGFVILNWNSNWCADYQVYLMIVEFWGSFPCIIIQKDNTCLELRMHSWMDFPFRFLLTKDIPCFLGSCVQLKKINFKVSWITCTVHKAALDGRLQSTHLVSLRKPSGSFFISLTWVSH